MLATSFHKHETKAKGLNKGIVFLLSQDLSILIWLAAFVIKTQPMRGDSQGTRNRIAFDFFIFVAKLLLLAANSNILKSITKLKFKILVSRQFPRNIIPYTCLIPSVLRLVVIEQNFAKLTFTHMFCYCCDRAEHLMNFRFGSKIAVPNGGKQSVWKKNKKVSTISETSVGTDRIELMTDSRMEMVLTEQEDLPASIRMITTTSMLRGNFERRVQVRNRNKWNKHWSKKH